MMVLIVQVKLASGFCHARKVFPFQYLDALVQETLSEASYQRRLRKNSFFVYSCLLEVVVNRQMEGCFVLPVAALQ